MRASVVEVPWEQCAETISGPVAQSGWVSASAGTLTVPEQTCAPPTISAFAASAALPALSADPACATDSPGASLLTCCAVIRLIVFLCLAPSRRAPLPPAPRRGRAQRRPAPADAAIGGCAP